ncbi:MAG: T9SS type A sorting domain-containing protein [Bacteroidota bacterium]
MKLDETKGGVLSDQKNILIEDSLTTAIAAIPNESTGRYWLILHGLDNNLFHVYSITGSEIEYIRSQAIGGMVSSKNQIYTGFLKASPDNERLVFTIHDGKGINESGALQLFAFENAKGELANPTTLGEYSLMYGVTFSPNSKLVYVQGISEVGTDAGDFVYQLNLDDPDPVSTRTGLILSDPQFNNLTDALGVFQLELAPNGKIYGGGAIGFNDTWPNNNLLVINQPNVPGRGFDVSFLYLGYSEQRVNNSLPTYIQSIFKDLTLSDNPNASCKAETAFSLYPNPTENGITIQVAERCFSLYLLSIYNSTGQSISRQYVMRQTSDPIDVCHLSQGLYMAVLNFEGKQIVKRFVKYIKESIPF